VSRERTLAFMSDLCRRDHAALEKWFIDSSVLWMPPTAPVTGGRRIVVLFRTIFRMYSDLNWKVTELHEVSPTKCIYLTDSWGTIGKDTPYKNSIMTLIEFNADGKIVFLSDYFKDTAIFEAGKKPAPTAQ